MSLGSRVLLGRREAVWKFEGEREKRSVLEGTLGGPAGTLAEEMGHMCLWRSFPIPVLEEEGN